MMVFAFVADIFFSSFVLAPITITFWWATWESFNFYGEIFRPWYQLGASSVLLVLVALLRDPISRLRHDSCFSAVLRRIYIYFCSVVGIGFWRSEWVLTDKNFNFELFLGSFLISLVLLMLLKCICNLNASPMCISLDHDPKIVFSFPTIFNTGGTCSRGGRAETNSELRACTRMRGSTAGISDGLKGSSHVHYLFLTALDHIISALVISPLVVGYWRGTWGLMDYYVFPEDPFYSSVVSIVIGFVGTMLLTLTQDYHKKIAQPDERWISYYFISRVYTACFAFICVNSWRGVWLALDTYTSMDYKTISYITFSAAAFLAVTRTFRNISASPFTIVTDRFEGYFDVPTLLKGTNANIWMYLLDCIFSVCVVGTLVVFVWRGIWHLLDMFLYPGQLDVSALASLAIGYLLVLITFALQPAMKYLARVMTGIPRIVVVDIYLLFSFCGTINVWRGVWTLLNVFLLPDMQNVSCLITHLSCFLILVLINSSNSILVRGVYLDGQEEGEQCVDFPCYYIRLFFQARQKRKFLNKAERRQKERRKKRRRRKPRTYRKTASNLLKSFRNKRRLTRRK